jgi:cytochrome c oxidase cbb3-type subunit 2
LGASRFGPDLTNFGGRKPTEEGLYSFLYSGSETHPPYRFLFEKRRVIGEPSPLGLKVTGNDLAAGEENVPTERARTLVSYLLSLNTSFDYPEARPAPPKKEPHAGNVPEKHEVTPIPTAAPDEKKNLQEQKK